MDLLEKREAALASEDGDSSAAQHENYTTLIGRVLAVVSLPSVEGLVCLPRWNQSKGALMETQVAAWLGKKLWELRDGQTIEINRDARLRRLTRV